MTTRASSAGSVTLPLPPGSDSAAREFDPLVHLALPAAPKNRAPSPGPTPTSKERAQAPWCKSVLAFVVVLLETFGRARLVVVAGLVGAAL